jgi:4-amino-4-deoxy-L-arabinose transferase-like glycosyltransferase
MLSEGGSPTAFWRRFFVRGINPKSEIQNPKYAWEMVCVSAALAIALMLGFSNLGAPSLWHDEAVQVLVAKSIAETGRALLPSGQPHPVAPVFNGGIAAFITLFGDSEAAVRAPSVVFAAVNVLLTYLLARPLLGRPTALVAAFALALSPWSVAWSRQARFYSAQQTFYLLTLWAGWRMMSREKVSAMIGYGVCALCAYLLGIGTSLHSLLFLGPIGAYALCMAAYQKRLNSRWVVFCALAALAGALTLLGYYLVLPARDAAVVFSAARPPVVMGDPEQTSRLYYVSWLYGNLGVGFFLLATLGFLLMIVREKSRGIFAALAFLIPLLLLSVLIGYRRHRFLLFAFPIYTMAFSYGIVVLTHYVLRADRTWRHVLLSVVIAIFGLRLGVSAISLVSDSIDVARGADTTLATRHPQYRKPCLYAREHLAPDVVVIADTYVTALYYVGRVDTWFPSRFMPWEAWEIGNEGLRTLEDLKEYMAQHPKGYFIAEWYRFEHFDAQKEERDWVNAHMRRIAEASSGDVTLYAWGI